MKLLNAMNMQEADGMAAHTAVLRMWDWRQSARGGTAHSDIYVNDGQGGWEADGKLVVVKTEPTGRKWTALHTNAQGETVTNIGTFPTKAIAKSEAFYHLVQKIGDGVGDGIES